MAAKNNCVIWATSWENLFMPYANNKGAFPTAEISRHYLVSSAKQAGLSLTWSHTPKTCFLMTRLICCYTLSRQQLLALFTVSKNFSYLNCLQFWKCAHSFYHHGYKNVEVAFGVFHWKLIMNVYRNEMKCLKISCIVELFQSYYPNVSNIVKILKLWTPEKIAVITLNFEQGGFTIE